MTDYARAAIFDERAYLESDVEMVEEFPYGREEPLSKNLIAIGFNFDDQGEQVELGSDLMRRQYTLEFFVFGTSPVWGRNLANALKFALGKDQAIPLKDVGQEAAPVVDSLEVVGVQAQRQPIPEPEPWQENVWLVTVRVLDFYYAQLV